METCIHICAHHKATITTSRNQAPTTVDRKIPEFYNSRLVNCISCDSNAFSYCQLDDGYFDSMGSFTDASKITKKNGKKPEDVHHFEIDEHKARGIALQCFFSFEAISIDWHNLKCNAVLLSEPIWHFSLQCRTIFSSNFSIFNSGFIIAFSPIFRIFFFYIN